MRQLHFSACIALVLVLCTSMAHGQRRPGFETLDHVIDQTVFEALCDHLRLSDEQRHAARFIFEPYFEAIEDLEAETEQRRQENRDWINEALRDLERDSPRYLELRATWSNRASRIIAESCTTADMLLLDFYASLMRMLSDEQRADLPAAQRLVRRMNHRFEGARISPYTTIFAYVPDLETLIDDASRDGGELADIMNERAELLPEPRQSMRMMIDHALLEYEIDQDLYWQRAEQRLRNPKRRMPDDMRASPASKERIETGCQRIRTVDRPMQRIVDVLRSHGRAEDADALELRYWRAWNPHKQMFIALPLDTFPAWLAERSDDEIDDDIRSTLQIMYSDYLRARHDAQRRVFEAALRAVCEDGGVGDRYRTEIPYARRIVDLAEVHNSSAQRMAGLLNNRWSSRFKDQFFDSLLARSMASGLSVHALAESGIYDPETAVFRFYDRDQGRYVQSRLIKHNGVWNYDYIVNKSTTEEDIED